MPKALVISRHFPPLGSAGGSIRLVKFLKYTSLNGWNFVVLTQDLEKTVIPEERLSASLLDDIPTGTQIERVPAPFRNEPQKNRDSYFSKAGNQISQTIFRDSSIAWGMRVFLRGIFNLKKWGIDLIYSVSPPFTDAFIGALMAVFGGKPYVLDLKDDWVGSPDFLRKSPFRQNVEKLLERMIIASSAAVLTVTQQSHLLYSKRYSKHGKNNKIFLIPNGCDLEEYSQLAGLQRRIETQKFTVLSAIWGFRKNYRDLTPFLLSLAVFFERHPEAKQNFTVILLGNSLSQEYKKVIEESGLQGIIQEMDAVNRKDLVKLMWAADLFLLIQPVGNTTAISGTLYEYWAVGKAPVLLISEKGASSSLVENYNIGKHFHFSEIEKCADYIEALYFEYLDAIPEWVSREGLENFDRRKLAEQVEKVWRETLKKL